MSYIDDIREQIAAREPDLEPALLDLYTLLALVEGANVSMEDVHDAWAIWRSRTQPDHRSIVPFEELSEEVQELDAPYAQAIASAAEAHADRRQPPMAITVSAAERDHQAAVRARSLQLAEERGHRTAWRGRPPTTHSDAAQTD